MFKKHELYVYDLPVKILDSIEVMYFDSFSTVSKAPEAKELQANEPKMDSNICRVCQKELDKNDSEQFRTHFQSDLHRLNLKRRGANLPIVNDEEFERLVQDDDNVSISGSDYDSEDDLDRDEVSPEKSQLETIAEDYSDLSLNDVSFLNTKSPYICFSSELLPEGKCFGVYKTIFTSLDNSKDPRKLLQDMNSQKDKDSHISALFMIGGGHFAGAIISHKRRNVKGNKGSEDQLLEQSVELVEHKTFHRYTTRRKQGGSQSASDQSKGKANSAGSSLRRYNEAELQKDVRELLDKWSHYLKDCQSVFIRANGSSNRNILVGYDSAPLQNNDPRVKSFPFTTKRATSSALKKAWVQLSHLTILDTPKSDEKLKQKLLKQQENISKSRSDGKKDSQKNAKLTPEEIHTAEIVSLIEKSRAPALIAYFRKNKLTTDFTLKPEQKFSSVLTPLHYAAAHGSPHICQVLLVNLKADPTVTNSTGRTPCEISASTQIKRAFQVARKALGESAWDWDKAHVGPPKSKDEFDQEDAEASKAEDDRKKMIIEEKLAETRQKFENQYQEKYGSGNKLQQFNTVTQQTNLSSLSEDQKVKLMREQRARAAEARMKSLQNK
ncbi:BA75_01423T0 [Komagataella pastoris]|uniref:BA75_01423T0 n=1 Tax=Komagataella pastoris TaxID=4922 RepID=A0A1B2J7S7_PICPA|nr:BA75_01423T0 [Komagataella pastoris]